MMMSANVCKLCYRKVQSFCHKMHCMNCAGIFHAKCVNLEKYELHTRLLWYSPCCVQSIFPYNHMDDDAEFYSVIIEGVLGYSYQFQEMNKKVFMPFEINDQSDTPLTEIDPDLQFYLETNCIRNTKCDYYMEDTFIKKNSTPGNHSKNLSLLHLNIKSLPRHYDAFTEYLTLLNFEFSCLGISETWLNECKEALHDILGYVTVSKYRTDRRGGGVSLYIRHEIPFTIRHDVDCFDSEMESIFIEIDRHTFQTPSNIVIGLIYRMPDTSVDIFNERITDILNIIDREKKIIYLIGDLNIDLFKCESHQPTSTVLDILYSHNVFLWLQNQQE